MSDVAGIGHPTYLQAPPAYPGKLLMVGSRGPAVKLAQKRLMKLGYPLARDGADGVFGVETVREVKAFQRVERSKNPKVEIDGKIGPVTWALLFA
jgi:peptidoglycan hydrolase-like protein with peptidoglycan-binding domain